MEASKKPTRPNMVVHIFNPSTKETRGMWLLAEFKENLVYIMSSRPVRTKK